MSLSNAVCRGVRGFPRWSAACVKGVCAYECLLSFDQSMGESLMAPSAGAGSSGDACLFMHLIFCH